MLSIVVPISNGLVLMTENAKPFKPSTTRYRPFPIPEDAVKVLEFIRKNPSVDLEEETASEIQNYMGNMNLWDYSELLKRMGLVFAKEEDGYRYTAIEKMSIEEIKKDTDRVYDFVKNNPDLCWGDEEYCKYRRLSVTATTELANTVIELDSEDKERILELLKSGSYIGIDIQMIQIELEIEYAKIYQHLKALYKSGRIAEEDEEDVFSYYVPEDRKRWEKRLADLKVEEDANKSREKQPEIENIPPEMTKKEQLKPAPDTMPTTTLLQRMDE